MFEIKLLRLEILFGCRVELLEPESDLVRVLILWEMDLTDSKLRSYLLLRRDCNASLPGVFKDTGVESWSIHLESHNVANLGRMACPGEECGSKTRTGLRRVGEVR